MDRTETLERVRALDRGCRDLGAHYHRLERTLLLVRGALVRELVGNQRGGMSATARDLGIAWTQLQRFLGEDLRRRIVQALDDGGVAGDRYVVRAMGARAWVTARDPESLGEEPGEVELLRGFVVAGGLTIEETELSNLLRGLPAEVGLRPAEVPDAASGE